jgi:tetratricopeptide (TPR) repeat protein
VIGKFIDGAPDSNVRAKEALDRALALNPKLSIAHKFYANLEAEIGQPSRAVVRLLHQAGRHGNDPELFAGLVHALRYCGLFEASIVAHDEARRLDPNVPTSAEQTIMMTCDLERLLAYQPTAPGDLDHGIRVIGLGLAGRREDALELLGRLPRGPLEARQRWGDYLRAWLEYRLDDMRTGHAALSSLRIMEDPEAVFQMGRLFCDVGDFEEGLENLQRAVRKGYVVAPTLRAGREFDKVRSEPLFRALLSEAETGRRQALAAFREAGGERLLGALE